jgi:hypothetical protein
MHHAREKFEVLQDERLIKPHLLAQEFNVLFGGFRREKDQDRITE